MKVSSLRAALVVVLVLAMAAGCRRAPEHGNYRREVAQQLDELTRRVDELSTQSKNAKGRTQAEAEHALSEIRGETDRLAREIDGLDSVASAKIDRTKDEIKHEVDDLKKRIEAARANLW